MKTRLHAMPAVLLTVFLGLVQLGRAESEPATGREPLVFEFLSHVGDASVRQEFSVREGEPFRVVTRTNSERRTVFGHVGTIDDKTVSIECTVEVYDGFECVAKVTRKLCLEIDVFGGGQGSEPYGLGMRGNPGALLITEYWIRRSTNPVSIFIKDLSLDDQTRVALAVSCLSRLAPESADAAPALAAALRRYDEVVANSDAERLAGRIARTLGEIGPKAKIASGDLLDTLKGPSAHLQVEAALALWRIEEHQAAIPRLVSLLEHPDRWVRCCAARALGEMRGKAKRAIPDLIKTLADDEHSVRLASARALWRVAKHPAAIDLLIGAMTWEDADDRRSAAIALGEIGPPAKTAVGALVKALELQGDWPRRAAAEALGKMRAESPTAIAALIRAWQDNRSGCQREAVAALRRIGPAAVAPLVTLLGDENVDWKFRCQAADTLGLLRADAAAAVPDLIAILEHPNGNIRQRAAQALGRIGLPAKEAIPALSKAVDTANLIPAYRGIVVRAAVEALGGIGPDAIEALRDALRHDNSYARRWAAIALGRLGPAAKAAAPDLIEALNDDNEYVRLDASRALRRIGWTRP